MTTVHVIDDDDDLRFAVKRLLESVGYQVSIYPSATAFLESGPPSDGILILDVRLPGDSGLALQDTLNAQGAGFAIIFISGHADVPMSVRAMKAGAVEFLQKPFRDQDLLDAVAAAAHGLRERAARRAQACGARTRFASLSEVERRVMALVVSGLMNKQIAATTDRSEHTVKIHRARVMHKMAAKTLADLVRMSDEIGGTARGIGPQ